MFDIKDKVVVITGAAVGIGASVVTNLLDENIKHISILDIDDKNGLAMQEELNTTHGSNKVKFIKCDVTQEHELVDAFKTVKSDQGYIDVVINNAAIGNDKLFAKQIDINLTGLVRGTVQAWNLMRKDEAGRGGTIVNVSSITALGSFPAVPIYAATKAAVVKLSTLLGDIIHYSRTGVRVLSVCIGPTKTQMLSSDKIGSFDSVIEKSVLESLSVLIWQTATQAADGLIEVYKKGESGTVWIVTSGKPAVDVTEKYVQSAEMFNNIISQIDICI